LGKHWFDASAIDCAFGKAIFPCLRAVKMFLLHAPLMDGRPLDRGPAEVISVVLEYASVERPLPFVGDREVCRRSAVGHKQLGVYRRELERAGLLKMVPSDRPSMAWDFTSLGDQFAVWLAKVTTARAGKPKHYEVDLTDPMGEMDAVARRRAGRNGGRGRPRRQGIRASDLE